MLDFDDVMLVIIAALLLPQFVDLLYRTRRMQVLLGKFRRRRR